MENKKSKIIETERLLLRPFSENDAEGIFAYLENPSVSCFADMKLCSMEQAREEAKRRSEAADDTFFAICLMSTGELIGELFSACENGDTYSPCWHFNEKHQGKGYAFEAAKAYFDYLFYEKNARRIYAYTEDDNLGSQKLCERLGMRKEGLFIEFISFVNNSDGTPKYEDTIQYAILKKEWDIVKRNIAVKETY